MTAPLLFTRQKDPDRIAIRVFLGYAAPAEGPSCKLFISRFRGFLLCDSLYLVWK
ncbi:MAG: hypothetical protein H6Q26_3045 [Bacteroidetes bacterium]|nr:hypothetical protein [Bacteroidota bacterium]